MFSDICRLPIAASSHSGEIFRIALPLGLLAGAAIVLLHLVITRFCGKAPQRRPWRWWEALIYLGTLGIIACLGFTAFAAVLRLGAIGGWWLFAHMCGAGALVAALPVLALMWADSNRLQIGPAGSGPAEPVQFLAIAKVAYWTILASGLVVSGTMIVSMLPWLGTPGQQLMLDVHRYAGLVCVVAAGVHLYGVALRRLSS